MQVSPPVRKDPQNVGTAAALRASPTAMLLSPPIREMQPPAGNILRNYTLNDVQFPSATDSMIISASRPMSMSLPPPGLAQDRSEDQIYLQAMNCTPTNFFEGFSSETAMMDYFSWHEQDPHRGGDPGPSGNGFDFQ